MPIGLPSCSICCIPLLRSLRHKTPIVAACCVPLLGNLLAAKHWTCDTHNFSSKVTPTPAVQSSDPVHNPVQRLEMTCSIHTNETQRTPCMHFQYHTSNQTQRRLLSVDHACGTVSNMCIGLVKLVWLVGLML